LFPWSTWALLPATFVIGVVFELAGRTPALGVVAVFTVLTSLITVLSNGNMDWLILSQWAFALQSGAVVAIPAAAFELLPMRLYMTGNSWARAALLLGTMFATLLGQAVVRNHGWRLLHTLWLSVGFIGLSLVAWGVAAWLGWFTRHDEAAGASSAKGASLVDKHFFQPLEETLLNEDSASERREASAVRAADNKYDTDLESKESEDGVAEAPLADAAPSSSSVEASDNVHAEAAASAAYSSGAGSAASVSAPGSCTWARTVQAGWALRQACSDPTVLLWGLAFASARSTHTLVLTFWSSVLRELDASDRQTESLYVIGIVVAAFAAVLLALPAVYRVVMRWRLIVVGLCASINTGLLFALGGATSVDNAGVAYAFYRAFAEVVLLVGVVSIGARVAEVLHEHAAEASASTATVVPGADADADAATSSKTSATAPAPVPVAGFGAVLSLSVLVGIAVQVSLDEWFADAETKLESRFAVVSTIHVIGVAVALAGLAYLQCNASKGKPAVIPAGEQAVVESEQSA